MASLSFSIASSSELQRTDSHRFMRSARSHTFLLHLFQHPSLLVMRRCHRDRLGWKPYNMHTCTGWTFWVGPASETHTNSCLMRCGKTGEAQRALPREETLRGPECSPRSCVLGAFPRPYVLVVRYRQGFRMDLSA